jgi:preprotein translocase subunit SecG
MGLFHFLIVVQGIVAAALVGVILMQRSEGGGLGSGGSPSGLMSARGAADFMTRTTTVLATAFIGLSVALAFVAAQQGNVSNVDESFKRNEAPAATKAAETPAAPGAAATEPVVAPDKNGIPLDR